MKYTTIVDEDIIDIISICTPEMLLSKLKNKSVLITGASGMLGSYFTYTLIKLNEVFNANINIKALVRNPQKLDDYIKNNPAVEIIIQDITQPLHIDGKVDFVIHAASPASPKIMSKSPVETNFANTLGTANTLMFAKESNADGYLFISSREIYGEPNENQILFEENGALGQVNPLVPRNGYAEGKKAAENMCSGFKEEYGLNTKIVRLAHTYGPGMSIYDGRVQADFLNNIIHNENIVLKSDGSSVRTYTYVADAISACFMVLLNSTDIVYNIGDENSKTSIRELAELLVGLEPEKGLRLEFNISDESQKGTASFTTGILSTQKIRNELGWKPKYNMRDGFKRTIEHLRLEDQLIKEEQVKLKLKKDF